MAQKIGPREMGLRAMTERRAIAAEEAAKAARAAARSKPSLAGLQAAADAVPVKRRPKHPKAKR